MKTFDYYLLQLIKAILFVSFMVWLCSCNSTASNLKMLHAYRDSLGIAKNKLVEMNLHEDSIRFAYSNKYPATAFDFTQQGNQQRKQWKNEERAAYHNMVIAVDDYKKQTAKQKIALQVKCYQFEAIIDSLKIQIR